MSIKLVTLEKLSKFKGKVYVDIDSRKGDTSVHVTANEKKSWNSKADLSAIPTDDHINKLIDLKLEAISNDSY